jgi:signal peptidase I
MFGRASKRGSHQPEHPGIHIGDDPDIEVLFPEEPSKGGSIWVEARSLIRDIIFAGLVALLVLVFVVRPVKVEGTSMEPRLETEERIFVNEFIYNFSPIERGDIVVFWYPDDPSKSFIKRVIGLPGETISIDQQGRVHINNRLVDEPYLSPDRNRMPRPMAETVVKSHYYFVMGDNRDASNDSRSWGLVPERYIYGKAMFRYWPLPRMGTLSD